MPDRLPAFLLPKHLAWKSITLAVVFGAVVVTGLWVQNMDSMGVRESRALEERTQSALRQAATVGPMLAEIFALPQGPSHIIKVERFDLAQTQLRSTQVRLAELVDGEPRDALGRLVDTANSLTREAHAVLLSNTTPSGEVVDPSPLENS